MERRPILGILKNVSFEQADKSEHHKEQHILSKNENQNTETAHFANDNN